ncbi:MAG: hypothetical protein IKJ52_11290 [Muribaculaceae bacterium]|nr:hypothetical protein [Muribaculaceae bacterium]
MKQHFNTGERRGLIVIIAILSIIIAATFFTRQCNENKTDANRVNNDSIATILRSKVESQKSTQPKESKTKKKKNKKTKKDKKETKKNSKKKKSPNKKSNNNFVERDPLNETLPTN